MGTRDSRASAIDSGLDVGLFDRRDTRRHHDWLTASTTPGAGEQAAEADERRGCIRDSVDASERRSPPPPPAPERQNVSQTNGQLSQQASAMLAVVRLALR